MVTQIDSTLPLFTNLINRRTQTAQQRIVAGDTTFSELQALIAHINTLIPKADDMAAEADANAVLAADASAICLAAAHFTGPWAALSGSLARPASVAHNSRFYLLVNDLADVALSEPGVSSDWRLIEFSLSHDLSPQLSGDLDGQGRSVINSPLKVRDLGAVVEDQTLDISLYHYFRLAPGADIAIDIVNLAPGALAIVELQGAGDYTVTAWKSDGVEENLSWEYGPEPAWASGTGISFAGFISPNGVKLVGKKAIAKVEI